jgi:hypothetical protein
MRLGLLSLLVLSCAGLGLACGDSAAKTDDDDAQEESAKGSYLPWAEGNTWTYRVTNNGVVSTKVVTIHGEEEVGGTGPHKSDLAFRVVTAKADDDQTVSWQVKIDERVLRYREQSFHATTGALEQDEFWAPYKLHFDGSAEHTKDGASWLESFEETKIAASGNKPDEVSDERDRWMVDSHSEKVTVPAGTFDAVIVQKAGGSDVKTYWYVRGVGKVRESGSQLEELVSFEVEK